MVDYGLLPPEINSGLIYAGPGAGSLLAAASAWSGLAADLQEAASGHRSVITALTSGPWLGPASASLTASVSPLPHLAGQQRPTSHAGSKPGDRRGDRLRNGVRGQCPAAPHRG